MYGLRPQDVETVRTVLKDVEESVSCRVGIAGSLAQRAISSEIAEALEGLKLSDIDLLLLDPSTTEPATPILYERFQVLERHREGFWYYGLMHRKNGIWVDLFEPRYSGTTIPVTFLGRPFEATRIESQVLHLARDILLRSQNGTPVRRKWQDKLRMLYALENLDRERLQSEFSSQASYFTEVHPDAPVVLGDYVRTALAVTPTPKWRDKLFLFMWWLKKSRRLSR